MTERGWLILAACVAGGLGVWLILPRRRAWGRRLGFAAALAGLGLFGAQVPRMVGLAKQGILYAFGAVTIISCVAAVSSRNPVYSAIWFGASLIGTAGLFLVSGAQFLAVATVVVYAGAILVTFLFVLMLAQPQGRAYYDRLSWEGLLSAATGAVLVGLILGAYAGHIAELADAVPEEPTGVAADVHVLAPEHVARLGGVLFGRHLISVQVAGFLLLAALVAAVAIVQQGKEASRGLARSRQPEPAPAPSPSAGNEN